METLSASAQYGDFHGEVSVDDSDHDDVKAFASAKGIEGLVIGMEFYAEEETQGLALYVSESGQNGDEIDAYAKSHGGKVKAKRYDFDGVTISQFLKLFKRFSL